MTGVGESKAAVEPGLSWSFKRSFITYVARMTDGQIMGGLGLTMRDAGTFVFAPEDSTESGVLAFRGELRLAAHAGALSLRIANPRIDTREPRAVMHIDNPQGAGSPMPFVTMSIAHDLGSAGESVWAGTDVRLTVEAVPLFGGYYGEGEQFDDFIAAVLLG